MKITRRALMQTAVVAPVAAQTPVTQDFLAAAREQMKRSGDKLAAIAMPMTTEPAFAFKP